MTKRLCLILLFAACTAALPSALQQAETPAVALHLSWRAIGPAMFAGRVADVAGVAGNRDILYVAAASSGLYKSINGGVTFEPVFEDGNTLSIGAIAVQPDNPAVVYVGTGEGAVRNSVSFGDGIYRTTDGGRTWTHLGLAGSERFSRICIDPSNPRVVIAAAMGPAFGAGGERGIYRTADGGVTWARTLHVNESTGASDVAIDPVDPKIVYAGMYDYRRQPWSFRSGGPGSGFYKSSDGGLTWKKLTDPSLDNGLPGSSVIGRIGISIHRADPRVVYTLIETQADGVLWRSDDRGNTWRIMSRERRINNRPFYYTQVRADPVDPERVYTLSGSFNVSTDGGRTFGQTGGRMFGDHHALWIDPGDPKRLLSGTDGGFFISNDRGSNWDFVNNMPMAQPYHVGVDMAEPYNVLGGFQDHEIWRGPNEKWNQVGVREGDWVRLRYMADGMHAIADPRDANLVYFNGHFGDITRVDMRNQEERYIQPYPPGPAGGGANLEQYRFNWNSPVHMSPSNPDILYFGGNVLFRTTDRGESWTVISPDLTTNDKAKQQPSGGPISPDNTRAEFHCTITAIAESPRDGRVIWAATDDGNLQITRDGGKTWKNVAPAVAGAPPFGWFSSVSASSSDAGTAYVTIDQHRLNDFAPYVFMTTDYGATWKNIGGGLRGYAHIVLSDPKQPSLLYVGTELGIWFSLDGGRSWQDLRLGLPPLAVVDMKVHPRDNDLIIATHARGFYILDDVTPLQELAGARAAGVSAGSAALFKPMPAVRYTPASDTSVLGNRVWVARNQPYGAIINYFLPSSVPAVQLTILDAKGAIVQTLNAPGDAGVNRTVWNLAERSSCTPDAASGTAVAGGRGRGGRGVGGGTWVRAVPGSYTVRLTAGKQALEQTLALRMDPRITVTDEDMAAWQREARVIEHTQCTLAAAARDLAELERKAAEMQARNRGADAQSLASRLRPIVLALRGDPRDPKHVNLPGRLNWLTIQVGNYSGRPTTAQSEWIATYAAAAEDVIRRLKALQQ